MAHSGERPHTEPGDPEVLDKFAKHSLETSMFFPQSRLMIAGNPKVAGTSLRWWLLPLHGVDVESLTRDSLWGESAPFQTIWDAGIDLKFTWNYLSADDRGDALSATDVLTVQPVRHPVTRAFSAWSGKYLNRESYYSDRLPAGFPEQPLSLNSTDQIAEAFEAFVLAMVAVVREEDWTTLDVHFWPQDRLLGRQPVGEILVLRQEEMAQGLSAIGGHLARFGVAAGEAPRINETIVPYQRELITNPALEALLDLYQGDLSTWSYTPEAPPSIRRELDLGWLNDVRGRNRRYQVIHEAAIGGRRRSAELEAALAQAREREKQLLSSMSWRITSPLRKLADLARRVLRRGKSS